MLHSWLPLVEERFKLKFPSLKRQFLSKEGRLTFLKSTLYNLPICYMGEVWLIEDLERLSMQVGSLERNIHLVN